MNKSQIIKIILFFVSILAILNVVNAADPISLSNNLDFIKLGSIMNNYRDVSPKNMFYQVEDWEREFCYRDVTKQLSASDRLSITPGGGIYDISITVNAYVTTDINSSENLYEIAWYFHPVGADTSYSISLVDSNGKNPISIANQVASIVSGDVGYKALKSNLNYTKAMLKYNGQSISYDILNKSSS